MTQDASTAPIRDGSQPWGRSTAVALRFFFIYFILYSVTTQLLGGLVAVPNWSLPMLGRAWPFENITTWFAVHVFGLSSPLINTGNSGDTEFYWVQTFWTLSAALLGTLIWSVRSPRSEHATLYKWFRLFLRFTLAAQMLYYGMAKVIPTQFAAPSLVTLVEPVGNLSITDLLWTSIGASTSYQIFTGFVEVLGGLLLLTPRTTLLGATICLAAMIQVFVLNLTYDFGLKQISFHLIAISLFLLAPDFERLANLYLRNRATTPAGERPLFASAQANRWASIGQLVFGAYLLVVYTNLGLSYWNSYGGGGYPKSPLYGIWNVTELSVDDQVRSPELNDYDRRWRRVIFDEPNLVVFQRIDDSFAHYGVSIDVNSRSMTLTKGDSRRWTAYFNYERAAPDRLTLDGVIDDHRVKIRLELVSLDTFRLRNNRFRWIRPPEPYAG
jgi:hypothetical protein